MYRSLLAWHVSLLLLLPLLQRSRCWRWLQVSLLKRLVWWLHCKLLCRSLLAWHVSLLLLFPLLQRSRCRRWLQVSLL